MLEMNCCYITIVNTLLSREVAFNTMPSTSQELLHMCVTEKRQRRKSQRHFSEAAAASPQEEHQEELGQIPLWFKTIFEQEIWRIISETLLFNVAVQTRHCWNQPAGRGESTLWICSHCAVCWWLFVVPVVTGRWALGSKPFRDVSKYFKSFKMTLDQLSCNNLLKCLSGLGHQ